MFTEAQIQMLLLTNAVTNACSSAVAFHTALALKEGLTRADVDAIRAGRSPDDGKLGALSTLARTLIERRGRIADQDREAFLAAGFGGDQLLEVVAAVAASTITNYTGNVTESASGSTVPGVCLAALSGLLAVRYERCRDSGLSTSGAVLFGIATSTATGL